ncbi:MAG: hypothetical protein WC205_19575 [Opitutaceae bacterium]|jgi:hypothetical protein
MKVIILVLAAIVVVVSLLVVNFTRYRHKLDNEGVALSNLLSEDDFQKKFVMLLEPVEEELRPSAVAVTERTGLQMAEINLSERDLAQFNALIRSRNEKIHAAYGGTASFMNGKMVSVRLSILYFELAWYDGPERLEVGEVLAERGPFLVSRYRE